MLIGVVFGFLNPLQVLRTIVLPVLHSILSPNTYMRRGERRTVFHTYKLQNREMRKQGEREEQEWKHRKKIDRGMD